MTRSAGDEGIASGNVGFHGVLKDMKDQDVGLKGCKASRIGLRGFFGGMGLGCAERVSFTVLRFSGPKKQ